ncbi:hypothetical protein CC85DRAFT_327001 [Cutaneotrichosporon oleaginosum]|uniref:Uncharacterized protein n=1 Tax=Cutaneotrichosporon oleaginosum TaxID=879819 RepID=A0A0J0XRW4_9TREE|nr:uncharacterized protein CC85DRAFT_327001 [Cutaneotrichosporon oleaginosum]KLT43866.1 hypothetical protein CC85DRAFT_327001 [Cutaneotrichosporon oleaginosum]TXT06394.1 hypothetical protein COLE_05725 [Cutaneotrichosporon oleaginosum]
MDEPTEPGDRRNDSPPTPHDFDPRAYAPDDDKDSPASTPPPRVPHPSASLPMDPYAYVSDDDKDAPAPRVRRRPSRLFPFQPVVPLGYVSENDERPKDATLGVTAEKTDEENKGENNDDEDEDENDGEDHDENQNDDENDDEPGALSDAHEENAEENGGADDPDGNFNESVDNNGNAGNERPECHDRPPHTGLPINGVPHFDAPSQQRYQPTVANSWREDWYYSTLFELFEQYFRLRARLPNILPHLQPVAPPSTFMQTTPVPGAGGRLCYNMAARETLMDAIISRVADMGMDLLHTIEKVATRTRVDPDDGDPFGHPYTHAPQSRPWGDIPTALLQDPRAAPEEPSDDHEVRSLSPSQDTSQTVVNGVGGQPLRPAHPMPDGERFVIQRVIPWLDSIEWPDDPVVEEWARKLQWAFLQGQKVHFERLLYQLEVGLGDNLRPHGIGLRRLWEEFVKHNSPSAENNLPLPPVEHGPPRTANPFRSDTHPRNSSPQHDLDFSNEHHHHRHRRTPLPELREEPESDEWEGEAWSEPRAHANGSAGGAEGRSTEMQLVYYPNRPRPATRPIRDDPPDEGEPPLLHTTTGTIPTAPNSPTWQPASHGASEETASRNDSASPPIPRYFEYTHADENRRPELSGSTQQPYAEPETAPSQHEARPRTARGTFTYGTSSVQQMPPASTRHTTPAPQNGRTYEEVPADSEQPSPKRTWWDPRTPSARSPIRTNRTPPPLPRRAIATGRNGSPRLVTIRPVSEIGPEAAQAREAKRKRSPSTEVDEPLAKRPSTQANRPEPLWRATGPRERASSIAPSANGRRANGRRRNGRSGSRNPATWEPPLRIKLEPVEEHPPPLRRRSPIPLPSEHEASDESSPEPSPSKAARGKRKAPSSDEDIKPDVSELSEPDAPVQPRRFWRVSGAPTPPAMGTPSSDRPIASIPSARRSPSTVVLPGTIRDVHRQTRPPVSWRPSAPAGPSDRSARSRAQSPEPPAQLAPIPASPASPPKRRASMRLLEREAKRQRTATLALAPVPETAAGRSGPRRRLSFLDKLPAMLGGKKGTKKDKKEDNKDDKKADKKGTKKGAKDKGK